MDRRFLVALLAVILLVPSFVMLSATSSTGVVDSSGFLNVQSPIPTPSTAPSPVDDNGIDRSVLNFFVANDGQWSGDVRFVTHTSFGSALFAPGGFSYSLLTSDNSTDEMITFQFVGANGAVPVGSEQMDQRSNYLYGSDPTQWYSDVPNYGRIVYANVWDGIDLSFHFDNGGLKYELKVQPNADVNDVRIKVSGAELSIQNGELVIRTANCSLTDASLVSYYADDHQTISSSFTVNDGTYSFLIPSRDPARAIVIDPLVYSTYLGGSGNDRAYSIAVDPSGNAYVAGYTTSTNLPTTSGAYRTTNAGNNDAFVAKLNATGTGLVYSTYIGGSGNDYGYGIAVDSSGCVFLTGYTASTNFPTTTGAYKITNSGGNDIFVTKLNAAGTGLIYSTYLGGSGSDQGQAIAIDSSGNAYVSGDVASTNFPTTAGAYQVAYGGATDSFVTKLNASGTGLIYSTYIGGSGTEAGFSVAVDSLGDAYLSGNTASTNFPTTLGAYQTSRSGGVDVFVTKINPAGSALVFSTYLGGTANEDKGFLCIDPSGNVYVGGNTASTNFPTTVGAYQTTNSDANDLFVVKLNASGTRLEYSTYLGGTSGTEVGHSIAVDPFGNAYVTGHTTSTNFPTTAGAFQSTFGGVQDMFLTKLNTAGTGLVYSTYLGGSNTDDSYAIAVDGSSNAYLTGYTTSTNYPITAGAYRTTSVGGEDIVISKVPAFAIPGMPTGLGANPGNAQVSLSWTAPASNGGANIDYYIVYQDGVALPGHPTGTSTTITGLTNGQTYSFTVAAHNAAGPGLISAAASATPRTLPGAPTGFTATAGDTNVSLSWTAPATNGGAIIDYYIVYQDGVDIQHVAGTSYVVTSLTNGQTYSFTLAAHNAAGAGPLTSAANATPITVPGPPTGLTAGPSDAQVSLSWSAPVDSGGASIDYYIVYQDGVDIRHVTGTSALITGLTNGQNYSFRVTAHNQGGESTSGGPINATPRTVPGAPTDLNATSDGGQVGLNWTAPANNGGSNIDYYVVYQDGVDVQHVTETSTTITGLNNGQTYTFTVAAHNDAGLGLTSAAATATPRTLPDAPTALSAIAGNSNVTLEWAPPVFNGGAGIDYYVVYQDGVDVAHVNNNMALITGLTNGQTYSFTVTAHNSVGESATTAPLNVTPVTAPAAPTALSGAPYDSSVTLSWSAPSDNGGLPVENYSVFRDGILIANTTNNWFVDSGLVNGQTYNYEVTAWNTAGESATSNDALATPFGLPFAPVISATSGNQQVNISWTAPYANGAPIENYTIYRDGIVLGNTTSLHFIDLGLINGASYSYQVSANNLAGEGPMSSAVNAIPATLPSVPENLTALAGNGTSLLSWTASSDNGGAVIDFYIIYQDGVDIRHVSGTNCTISGLTNGVQYAFSVAAHNSVGAGMPSSGASTIPYSVPNAPIGLTANPGNAQVSLSWTAPGFDGGRAIDYYIVYQDGVDIQHVLGTACIVTGLNNGQSYSFTVAAHNAAGPGPNSVAVSATPKTLPGAPTGLMEIAGDTNVSLSWNAPASNGGAGIDYYIVYQDGVDVQQVLGTSYIVPGLTNGQTYSFTVAAHNAVGMGPLSLAATAIPITQPGVPTGLLATPGIAQVSLSWDPPVADGGTGIDYYIVYQDGVDILHIPETSAVITGLGNGQLCSFTVAAHNAAGTGARSSAASATTFDVPSAPLNIVATAGVRNATVTWDPPAVNNGATVTSYKVFIGTVPGQYSGFVLLGDVRSHVFDGLLNGTTYYFSVEAINAVGQGAMGSDAMGTTPSVPGEPSIVAVTAGDEYIAFNWTAPSSGGSVISEYLIYRAQGSGAYVLLGSASRLWYNDTTVANGIPYHYHVVALNAVGESHASTEVSATPGRIPDAPRSLTAEAGLGNITLHWSPPANDGGFSIVSYNIYRIDGTKTTLLATVKGTTYLDIGLNLGQGYRYQVSALNSLGEGPTTASIGNATLYPPAPPISVEALQDGSAINVTWVPGTLNETAAVITGYAIYRDTSDGQEVLIAKVSASTTSYLDTDASGQVLSYRVAAIHGEPTTTDQWTRGNVASPAVNNSFDWSILIIVLFLLLLLLLLLLLAAMRRKFYVVVKDTMAGQLFNRMNKPIQGAEIRLETGQKATTDAEGRFKIKVTPRTYTMTAEKDGRKSGPFTVSVAPGQTYKSDLFVMKKRN